MPETNGIDDETRPKISVVVPTRDRPLLLRRTIDAIMAQDYFSDDRAKQGAAPELIVVFDQTSPDETLLDEYKGSAVVLRLLSNKQTPGLAGARNCGVLAAEGELVAFCDDDDIWHSDKLHLQLAVLEKDPELDVVTSGVTVKFEGRATDRIPRTSHITFDDLLADRVFAAHPSTVVVRRSAMVSKIGLVDEEIPGSYGEDYEWILRAARLHPVAAVQAPLVDVLWGTSSFFSGMWATRASALRYLLDRYPEFERCPKGRARIEGQIAFGTAGAGHRREALRWVRRTLRDDWRQPRAYLAAAVASGFVSADTIVGTLQRRGRGI